MRLEFAVDWLNYTCFRLSMIGWYHIAKKYPGETWHAAKPLHGYTRAAENTAGARVMINPEYESMGQHVQYSGRTINQYMEAGISAREIVLHHALFGDVCKRIDLAIDTHDSGINLWDYFKLVDNGFAKTRAKSWRYITGENQGATVYIGSRQSEVMLRIYNKAAEQDVEGDWIRAELELKGSRAVEVARMLSYGTEESALETARGLMRGLVNFDTEAWREITGNSPIVIAKAKDTMPDTEAWLMSQVATAMARLIKRQGSEDLIKRFVERVREIVADIDDTPKE